MARLAAAAHEVALRRALTKLADDFDRWRRGEMASLSLADRIREFREGPDREVLKRFPYDGDAIPVMVAWAVANGLVDAASVSAEAMPYIAPMVEFWRDAGPAG
jgi:hypothetical protein